MENKTKLIHMLFDEYAKTNECYKNDTCHPVIYEQERIIESDYSWVEKNIRFNCSETADYKKVNDKYIFLYDEKLIEKNILLSTESESIENLIASLTYYIGNNIAQKFMSEIIKNDNK